MSDRTRLVRLENADEEAGILSIYDDFVRARKLGDDGEEYIAAQFERYGCRIDQRPQKLPPPSTNSVWVIEEGSQQRDLIVCGQRVECRTRKEPYTTLRAKYPDVICGNVSHWAKWDPQPRGLVILFGDGVLKVVTPPSRHLWRTRNDFNTNRMDLPRMVYLCPWQHVHDFDKFCEALKREDRCAS